MPLPPTPDPRQPISGKTILSGIQPSGVLHIGNYLGAIRQWVALQADNRSFFCIVDEHAITVPYEPEQLRARILDAAAIYLACGIDPEKSAIFVQSHLPEHTELAWLLSTITPYGELTRMTQFKEKSDKHTATLGLFAYPVLMAADILLYQADIVPVGEDQIQHLELARGIAERFNNRFGVTFTVPEALVSQTTARIMSLQNPEKKMSKSDPDKTYISLLDDPETIHTKISSAVTETEPVFLFEESGSAVQNLLNIYRSFSDMTPAAIEQQFAGKGYKEFKEALADLLADKLAPIQKNYQELRGDENSLRSVLAAGKKKAQAVAAITLQQVKEKMGLL